MPDKIEQGDELSEKDEQILDKIWLEILREEESKETWGKSGLKRRD